jgi:hypothetical protein
MVYWNRVELCWVLLAMLVKGVMPKQATLEAAEA